MIRDNSACDYTLRSPPLRSSESEWIMRLVESNKDGEFSLTKDFCDDIPKYAILSHKWVADTEEVTFKDLIDGTGNKKDGYAKPRFFGEQARQMAYNFGVDTCCIDKSNNTELSEAINSIFDSYLKAVKCYVYLSDVSINYLSWQAAFQKSRWFTRGWTLQELIAPPLVDFFCSEGIQLGDRNSLEQQLYKIIESRFWLFKELLYLRFPPTGECHGPNIIKPDVRRQGLFSPKDFWYPYATNLR